MSRPQDLLVKKLKFKKFDKYLHGRRELMAISLPTNPYAPTYLNAMLARFLKKNGVKRVHLFTDPENEAIALEVTNDIAGFSIIATGKRGIMLTARLRKIMPLGRYVFVKEESNDKMLVFRREIITYKGKEE